MPSTYSANLKTELIATGEKSGTWGQVTNNNLSLIDQSMAWGYIEMTLDADLNLLISDGLPSPVRGGTLWVTSTVPLTATRTITLPAISRSYIICNRTLGGQTLHFKAGSGTIPLAVYNGKHKIATTDGYSLLEAVTSMGDGFDLSGSITLRGIQSLPDPGSAWAYPTLLAGASVLQVTNSNPAYGMARLSGGWSGRTITIVNMGANPFPLYDYEAAAPASDRFWFGAPATVQLLHVAESISLINFDCWRTTGRTTIVIDGGTF